MSSMNSHEGPDVRRWTVGDVTVTRIVEHQLPLEMGEMFPKSTREELAHLPWLWPDFLTPEGQGILSMHALVVDTPSKRIIVDTCVGNDKDRAPFESATNLQTSFLRDLEQAGFARESFDYVVCTHMHFDHVGWNTMLVGGRWQPTFPQARYLFGKREMEQSSIGNRAPPKGDFDEVQRLTFVDSLQPVLDAGLVDLVDEDHRICDEVALMPTPGHTQGHVSVVISSQGRQALITGDMAHHPCQLAHPDWGMPLDADEEMAIATRRQIFSKAADEEMLVIGTHWAGRTGGTVSRVGDAFRLHCDGWERAPRPRPALKQPETRTSPRPQSEYMQE